VCQTNSGSGILVVGWKKSERTVNSKTGNNFSKYRLRLHVVFIGSGKELLFASKLLWSSWLRKAGFVFEKLIKLLYWFSQSFPYNNKKKKTYQTTY